MPSHSRRDRPQDSTTTEVSGAQEGSSDQQDLVGNRSIWDWFLDLFRGDDEHQTEEQTPTLDAFEQAVDQAQDADDLAILEDAAQELDPADAEQAQAEVQESVFQKSGDLERVELSSGSTYKVSSEDMAAADSWKLISDNHGMKPELLQAFNQHITEVSVGGTGMSGPVDLAVGAEIYIPSAQEVLFAQCRQKASSYDEAISLWGQLSEGPNVKMMDAARARASGKVGESYGVEGVDGGKFYSPNTDLVGASDKRSVTVAGQTEYKVMWTASFWKCSVFMEDVVWQAGYKPHLTANKHYLVAGKVDQSDHFSEVLYNKAMPGDAFQRYGGTGSDQSHNAVLSDFPKIEDLGNGTEKVTYDIVGAGYDRAAEGGHESIVKKGTSEVVSGYGSPGHIRFFRPSMTR